jgi:O-methyltransferase
VSADPPISHDPRPIRATGPGADPESLRTAYLELLKLSLCDLVGVETQMVWRGGGRVFSRTLPDDEQRQWRVDGSDWPLNGLTMIGLRRLDDLQTCVESIIADGLEGDLIECGAWRGGASILIRATLDSLGQQDRTIVVADSFQGFPAPDDDSEDQELEIQMNAIDYLAPELDAVRGHFERFGVSRGVEFVPGFFEDTLADLTSRRWALIRLDADSYSATKLALESLYPNLAVGGYLVVDDYFHLHLPACRQAVDEFRRAHGIEDEIARIDWTGARWRKHTEVERQSVGAKAPAGPARRAAAERTGRRIPTDHELELELELARVRERVYDEER